MKLSAKTVIALIAALHLYIAWFEIFAWETRGPQVFPFPPELFADTIALAANQGVYNAFLAAGLIWALTIRDAVWWARVGTFFLACVAVAGIAGAVTVSPRIALVQTVPALIGIGLIVLWRRREPPGI